MRDVLLGMYVLCWATVMVVTLIRVGTVPAELFGALGYGVGAIVALFHDRPSRSRRSPRRRKGTEKNG